MTEQTPPIDPGVARFKIAREAAIYELYEFTAFVRTIDNIPIHKISEGEREELRKILKVIKLCEEYGYKPSPSIYNWSIEELKASLENWSSRVYEELEKQYDILKLCADYGIYYHPNKSGTQELFEYSIEEVELALKHFIKVGGNETRCNGKPIIFNPQGWLIRCLAEEWWEPRIRTWIYL